MFAHKHIPRITKFEIGLNLTDIAPCSCAQEHKQCLQNVN